MANGDRITTAFPHDEEYKKLNEGAHPSVPPRLSMPAVNWHTAFWRPKVEPVPGENALALTLERLLIAMANVDGVRILNINGTAIPATGDDADTPLEILGYPVTINGPFGKLARKSDARLTGNPFRLESCNIALLWKEQLIKIAVATHREFALMTFWLPVFQPPGLRAANLMIPENVEHPIAACLAQNLGSLLMMIDPRFKWDDVSAHLRLPAGTQPITDPAALSLYLYEQVWTTISDTFLKPFVAAGPAELASFADFRSILLPAALPHNRRDSLQGDTETRFAGKKVFSNQAELASEISKFLEMESNNRAELTGSTFLDNRVLYLSTLGSPAATRRHHGLGRSARYVMVAQPMWRWQVGRLVERLNMLGTYRLAALRDLEHLNIAGFDIKQIGADVDAAQPGGTRDIEASRAAHRKLQDRFAKIGVPAISGGLSYRVDRSRAYVAAFKRLLPDLRIERIEGYQRYDEFVTRRYAIVWDRIASLRARHERLARRMDYLDNRLATEEQIEQTRIQLQQTRELKDQSKVQSDLLRAAEIVGGVAFAYYGGNLLAGLIATFTGYGSGEHAIASALVMLALFVALLARREFQSAKSAGHPPEAQAKWLLIAALFIAGAAPLTFMRANMRPPPGAAVAHPSTSPRAEH